MKRTILVFAAIMAFSLLPAAAQMGSMSEVTMAPPSAEIQAARLREQAADLAAATDLVKQLKLSCDVVAARAAAAGPDTVNGKSVDTKTYEAACGNGMGYFLVSRTPEEPAAYSCFGAQTSCTLPANADLKKMASAVMEHAGAHCAVRDFSRLGMSRKNAFEYVEVNCEGGKGYILAVAPPGTPSSIQAIDCADALLKVGFGCRMPANAGTATATIQAFKDALVQHGMVCDASDVRPIGQESVRKRYVVEFKCPQQQRGLVAFIPLAGNPNPFEAFDCIGAARFGIVCKLTAKRTE